MRALLREPLLHFFLLGAAVFGLFALLDDTPPPPMAANVLEVTEDDARLLHHEEPVWRDGKIVGAITSGMYGHRLGASLGMGYVRHEGGVTREWLAEGGFEVEVAWQRVPARLQLEPFYDPEGARVRA